VLGAGRADLDVDGDAPVGGLAQLQDLDGEVVGARPVGVAAGRALVDALGEGAHPRDAGADLLPEEHAAAARLGALAEHHLDGVGLAQVVGVEPVAGRQALVDEDLGRGALLGRHAAVAGRRGGADLRGGPAERVLGGGRQRAERHAGDGDRDVEHDGVLGVAGAQDGLRLAALPVALQRVAGGARGEEQQVVEGGHGPAGAHAADGVAAEGGAFLDLGDDRGREGVVHGVAFWLAGRLSRRRGSGCRSGRASGPRRPSSRSRGRCGRTRTSSPGP